MAKGKDSGLKRDAETAFEEYGGRPAERSRRRKPRVGKWKQQQQQRKAIQSSRRDEPTQKISEFQSKAPKTPRVTNLGKSNSELAPHEDQTPKFPQEGRPPQQSVAKRPTDRHARRDPRWALSVAEGGRFAPHDAIMVQDDRYLIVSVPTQVLVYSTASSQLLRSMRIEDDDHITSLIVYKINRNHLLVSTYSGILLQWDWTTGEEIKRWESQSKILCIADQIRDQNNSQLCSLLLIHEGSYHGRRLSEASLVNTSSILADEKTLLEYQSTSSWMKVLPQAKCLVLYAESRLILGQLARNSEAAQGEYIWREIALPQSITSIDARSHPQESGRKKTKWAVDVVVGCENGAILLYEDILSRLVAEEKNPGQGTIVSRRFHWHRNEVLVVKWSLDGNYIISGGHETVLVFWQLDTGHRQFLPHLSAAIQHLTISQTGSAYTIHLADNSVVVLSASELQPTAYVGGVSLGERRRKGKAERKVPAAVQYTDSLSIALAVPADSSVRSDHVANATLLQTYDLQKHKHTGRQALARNNITTLNIDPSGKPIQEPDVTHLQISHDGKWLVTVDEWSQPAEDSESLRPASENSQSVKGEVFLKFWSRNESTRSWELVTKVESPHSTAELSSNSILDLKASPRRTEFSTVSSSGSVDIWTPKRRHRGGFPVKGPSGAQLFTWTSTHTVDIPAVSFPVRPATRSIKSSLAYSSDGSVLATSSNKSAFVTFVDPEAGTIKHMQRGSYPSIFSELAFFGHHLITISKDLRVYNAVNGELLWALSLDSAVRDVFLAVNEADKTFTVAFVLPHTRSSGRNRQGPSTAGVNMQTQISVFHPHQVNPIYSRTVERRVEILLPLSKESGYLLIDDDAEILRLQPSAKAKTHDRHRNVQAAGQQQAAAAENPSTKSMLALEALKKDWLALETSSNPTAMQRQQQETEDQWDDQMLQATYKTQASLEEVFERSTTDLPVRTLFERVFGALRGERAEEGRGER